MQKGYIPTPKASMCHEIWNDLNNVCLDSHRADLALQKCVQVKNSDQLLNEFAAFIESYRTHRVIYFFKFVSFSNSFTVEYDFHWGMNLFDGKIDKASNNPCLYSMKGVVSDTEMSTLWRKNTTQSPTTMLRNVHQINQGWQILWDETSKSIENSESKKDSTRGKVDDFDYEF